MTMQKDMERRRPAVAQSMGMTLLRTRGIGCQLLHIHPNSQENEVRGRKLGIIHASWRYINKQAQSLGIFGAKEAVKRQ